MKPRKASPDGERKELCDLIVERAAAAMEETGAPIEMILDRLLTFAGAQAFMRHGKARTAEIFRELAENIENGVFDQLSGQGAKH